MAAGKRYSAGAIFLQVVPVFSNVQRAIEDEAKGWDRALGDHMERAGEKAGERAGKAASRKISDEMEKGLKQSASDMEKALGGINTKNLGKRLRAEIKEMRSDLASLSDVDLKVDANFAEAEAKLRALRATIEDMRKRSKVFFDIAGLPQVYRQIKALETRLDAIRDVEVDVDVNTKAAERKIGAFERSLKASMEKSKRHIESGTKEVGKLRDELDYLSRLRVGIDIGSNQIRREVAEITADLKRLSMESPDVDVRVDAGRAYAELAAWEAAVKAADKQRINVKANVNTDSAQRGLFGLKRSSDDAANSFRSFNGVLFAAAGAGPALIPVLGAIAGGLLAIGPAAAVATFGIGSVLVGFSGIGDAVTALQNRQDQAATTAQTYGKQQTSAANAVRDAQEALADAERNAARAAEDAAERVKDAREAAAEAVEAALERQKDAQEAYAESVQNVKDAEEALREARANAAGTGEDLDDQIRQGNLAIDQAILDSFDATNNYNAVMADGSSTNAEQEQARITMEQARERLHELREEQAELEKQKRKWEKDGVNGTEEVQDAQDNLTDAIEAQRDAYENVRDAAEAVDEARRDGAESVRDAIEAQNETLADNKRAIEDARQALADARRGQDDLNESINAQQQAVDVAFGKLGPAGRKFALFLYGLRDDFREFRNDIQAAMLPSIQEAIEEFMGSRNAGIARDALIGLAGAFGEFTKALSVSLQGEAWQGFFKMIRDAGPDLTESYGNAFISFMEAMASIMTTLAPFAEDFADGLERMMGAFAGWADSKSGQDSLREFMGYVEEVAPHVTRFLGAFAEAATALLVAMAPWGSIVLDVLTGFLEFIANMDPGVLAGVVTTILILITASQTAYAVMNLLMAGGALLTSTIGLLVFTLVALGAAIYWVYHQNKTLGIILGVVVGAVMAGIAAWKLYLFWQKAVAAFAVAKAAVSMGILTAQVYALTVAQKVAAVATRVWAAAQWVFNAAMAANPLGLALIAIVAVVAGFIWAYKKFEWFRDAVWWVIDGVKEIFFDLWDFLFGHSVMPDIVDGMMWASDMIGKIFGYIADFIRGAAKVFGWLWTNVVRPVASFIWKAFKVAFGFIRQVWNNILKPVLTVVGKVIWTLWKVYFKVALTLIKAYFKTVFLAIQFVWNNILRPVFSAIGRVVGWLWKNVVKPTMGWIGEKFGDVFRGMKWVWDNVLKPVFDFIGDKALPKLKGAFETAVDGIQTLWNGLKRVVGAPIKFVLDTIINKGLIAGFNKVAGWVNMDGFDEIPIPKALQSYATGGILPGYTPGRDPHKFYSPTGGRLELSGGEAIMRPEFTRAVGPSFVDEMNAAAMAGGVNGVRKRLFGGQAFAKGGVYFPVPKGWYINRSEYNLNHDGVDINHPNDSGPNGQGGTVPFMSATGGSVSYVGYGRGYGLATFVNSPYGELVYGHAYPGSTRTSAGQPVSPGQVLGLIGTTGNSSAPHLHFGFPGGTFGAAMGVLNGAATIGQGAVKNAGRSVPGFIKDLLLHPIDTIKGWATSTFSKASDFITGTPVWNTLKNVPSELVSGFKDKAWDIVPTWAKKAVGVAGKVVDGVKDVGGAIGDGLDSVVPGDGIPGFAKGGILPYNGTMMYDNGGYLPPGLTSVVNLTGKPEPVFTADQWDGMEGGQGGNIHYEPHFEGTNLTPEDVAADLNFTFRRIRRGGKYAGVGQ